MKTALPFALSFLCVLTTACGGGGGGGAGGNAGDLPPASTDPGIYRPTTPPGLGQAGPMDGRWIVTALELLDDPRTQNPDLEDSFYLVGDEIEFRGGRIHFDDSEPIESEFQDPNGTPLAVALEFAVNDPVPEGTLFGFGLQFGPNWLFGPGAKRIAIVFGTTGPSTAIGVMVDAEQLAGAAMQPVDRFQVVQFQLERVSSLPSELEATAEASAGETADAVPLDGRSVARALLRSAFAVR